MIDRGLLQAAMHVDFWFDRSLSSEIRGKGKQKIAFFREER